MTARRAAVAGLVVLLGAAALLVLQRAPVIEVRAGDDLQRILDEASPGAIVRLFPGEYEGPFRISKPLILEGSEASIRADKGDRATITVVSDRVQLSGITVFGGGTGVVIRESEGVELRDVTVRGADMHGIEVIDAAARITGANVGELTSEYAQGIEIRNSDGRPDSSVIDSVVVGGQEGIVSHVSEVIFEGNTVSQTTMRAIAVTEMSDGIVSDNQIHDAAGAALYCGDMSRCQFEGNTSGDVNDAELGNSASGWGLVVTYHAVASSNADRVSGVAGESFSSLGGRISPTTPLEIGAGAAAVVPVGVATAIALVTLCALFLATRRFAFPRTDRTATWKDASSALVAVAALLVAVQSFHMFEHLLQIYRVRVDGIPSRGGLVGPAVEGEWVHFLYNFAVLTLLGGLLFARRNGWTPRGGVPLGDRLVMVAVAVQSFHMVEHSVKLTQHLVGGAKVNDGIGGAVFDLVLYHYALNLIVYLATASGVFVYLWRKPRLFLSLQSFSLRDGGKVQPHS